MTDPLMTKEQLAKLMYDALVATDKSCFAIDVFDEKWSRITLDGQFDFAAAAETVLKGLQSEPSTPCNAGAARVIG